eukprot:CAMPEP_0206606120 /NCGR_PEP_ID=MMETSP0325_2-20121206/51019_1 /ASSEMBLY_ACC=CAM_ASM_000347 /TAXON_ID=2866 /ORGANISM="Crypthecodinium cohnii, Strain Seligo" /LENGTH=73 /DNA_ID=CAMNT_0054122189 /DNA_START=52 /DNA_END=270 /DNA_ORIENTATION=+
MRYKEEDSYHWHTKQVCDSAKSAESVSLPLQQHWLSFKGASKQASTPSLARSATRWEEEEPTGRFAATTTAIP